MICAWCGDSFEPRRKGAILCSKECRYERNKLINKWNRWNRERKKKVVPIRGLSDTAAEARRLGLSYGEYQARRYREG